MLLLPVRYLSFDDFIIFQITQSDITDVIY